MEKAKTKTKDVALVLSSGGPRGFAYIGGIEELERRGYRITSVAGCSIGSLVGGIYAAGGLEDFKKWLFRLNNYKLLSLLDVSVSKSYLVKGERVIEAIKKVVPNVNIEDLRIPYRAVASDLYTGEEVVFSSGKLFDAIRASISIPSLFRPVHYGRHTLIDGGAVNTAPFSIVPRNGHDILACFDVNQLDSERIADYITRIETARASDPELKEEISSIFETVSAKKGLSVLDMVKTFGSETRAALQNSRSISAKVKALETEAAGEKMPFLEDDNYYSILSRTFSLMLRSIATLQIEAYKPEILVKMSFDAYSTITDYAKGEEIAEKGRALMAEALDRYESGESAILA